MYKIFGSGTCRLLHTLYVGQDTINSIHSYCGSEFHGNNFMGKQKNSRNHIQFLKYIKGEIDLPVDIKNDFFSAYHIEYEEYKRPKDPDINLQSLRNEIDTCDVYLFEIASIKIQTRDNYCVSDENTTNYVQTVQTKEELINDLEEIIRLVGINKKIIFLNHLRLDQFGGGPVIENRETVYSAIYETCQKNPNVYQYDPTLMVKNKSDYKCYFADPWHYTPEGMNINFNNLYNLINVAVNNVPVTKEFINSTTNINRTLYDSEDENPDYHKMNLYC